MESLRFLLRDRDGKYGEAFDAVFRADDLRVIKSAPQAPRMNAHCERIIGSIRREALDHIVVMGEAHARHILATYQHHYNHHRPHQARSATNYRPRPGSTPPRYTTSMPTGSCAPGSWVGRERSETAARVTPIRHRSPSPR
jgi:putative transposase